MALPYRSLTLVALGFTLTCLSGQALSKDFYKWEDAAGVTHYSAQPPKDRPSIKVRATNIRDTASAPQSSNAPADKKAAAANTAAPAAYQKDPERCAAAQKNLKTMQEHARIRIKEGDEYRYLTPEEISEHLSNAQAVVAEDC
ncbi:DUF4124 domain-containing protein [Aestuariicella hydrocarbonica]|uniref:DUF4124 domain-containing protein n=1 Tax=Pseudomaricurvus hydrocarbonicus TaxID=1470433 RepID=A0A9E5JSX9_9GAMM|nr:DUF4124 domain-containing protein [Aestuariicella hydrocarbonica]NHO66213.1 DUF4124 domain-containing protein [Aestuariicella hydrocarbonica]